MYALTLADVDQIAAEIFAEIGACNEKLRSISGIMLIHERYYAGLKAEVTMVTATIERTPMHKREPLRDKQRELMTQLIHISTTISDLQNEEYAVRANINAMYESVTDLRRRLL